MENILISDIHLGSDMCQADSLCQFLKGIEPTITRRLIIVGDIFDSIDLRRLKKHHWKVLSHLRRLSDQIEVIWITGNHDGPAEIVSHFLGVEVYEDYVLESGHRKCLIMHGHKYDRFVRNQVLLTWFGDFVYWILQKVDTSHRIARMAKKSSKIYLRCASEIREAASLEAASRGCNVAICGHTHHAEVTACNGVLYCNTGCWTEKPCTYLTVSNGMIELNNYLGDVQDTLD